MRARDFCEDPCHVRREGHAAMPDDLASAAERGRELEHASRWAKGERSCCFSKDVNVACEVLRHGKYDRMYDATRHSPI